jgi:hypothetical protein
MVGDGKRFSMDDSFAARAPIRISLSVFFQDFLLFCPLIGDKKEEKTAFSKVAFVTWNFPM